MANTDRPNGFSFAKTLNGSPATGMIRKYKAADRSSDTANDHGDIYIGDPVTMTSTGVVVANSGDVILGVAMATGSVEEIEHGSENYFNADNLEQRFLAADKEGYVAVMPANGIVFEVQTATDLDLVPGATADINSASGTAHGSRDTSKSNVELVASSNEDVTVVELVESPDNDPTLANARYLVQFNQVAYAQYQAASTGGDDD